MFSYFSLHWVNDLPGALEQVRHLILILIARVILFIIRNLYFCFHMETYRCFPFYTYDNWKLKQI